MIKRLMQSVREYKKDSILAPLYVSCEVVLEVIIPFLTAALIDKGIDAGDMNYVLKIGMLLILCALISLTFGILSGRSASIAAAGFAKNLRKDMFDNVQNFSFSNRRCKCPDGLYDDYPYCSSFTIYDDRCISYGFQRCRSSRICFPCLRADSWYCPLYYHDQNTSYFRTCFQNL